jgi:hypothetical protein
VLRNTVITLGLFFFVLAAHPAVAPRVQIVATPDAGIQPQALTDSNGTLHLLYFKGDPAAGDLYYTRRGRAGTFSPPLRVNSEPGSAIATGSVRGGRLALGRNGWIHVGWDAAQSIERNGAQSKPMWYARLAPGAKAFEAQRAIGEHTNGLDGGALAADDNGHVSLVWHAVGAVDGEAHRPLYVVSSTDDGARFAPERTLAVDTGVCSCCQVDATFDARGALQILYRGAAGGIHRDATWLTVAAGRASSPLRLQAWELNACPMTTFAMAPAGQEIIAAWETQQQIYTAALNPRTRTVTEPSAMSGSALRKHPSVAVNARGDRLFAWTEGTAWARGGTLAWELRDRNGVRLDAQSNAGAVPVWGLVAAVARPDGAFLVIH